MTLAKPRRVVAHALFAALALSSIFYCVEVDRRLLGSVGTPFVSFGLTPQGYVSPLGIEVWGADDAGLKAWDRIVAVNGELVFSGSMVRRQAFGALPPVSVIYQVKGIDDTDRFVAVSTRMLSPSDLARSQALLGLLGLICIMTAVLLYFLRPGAREAWAFFFFFSSVGICMTAVVDESMVWRFNPLFGYVAPFMGACGIILAGVLSGALYWPKAVEEDALGRRLNRAMWTVAVISIITAATLAIAYEQTDGHMTARATQDSVLYAWLTAASTIGLLILFVAYRRGRSPRRRARIRQILLAVPVGAGIPSAVGLLTQAFGVDISSFLWNGFIILLPLSTADAIVRHDLLRLSTTSRRFVGGMTVATATGVGMGVVLWSTTSFVNVRDAPGMIAIATLLFAVASPVSHRMQSYIERLLRSRHYDPSAMLAEFNSRAATAKHLRQVIETLADVLRRSVAASTFEVLRLRGAKDSLETLVDRPRTVLLDEESQILLDRGDVAIFDEEEPAPQALPDCSLALRLAVAGEAVGLLVLGERADELPYDGVDVAFIVSLAGPLSAAIVNARSYEEVERLNRELEARVIERTRALAETNAELELLNARKDELVATVSHDFRSPLAIIRQNAQTLLRDFSQMDDDDARHFLDAIARQESRPTEMCESLLDLARLKQPIELNTVVDIKECLKLLVASFRSRAEPLGIQIEFSTSEEQCFDVVGDAHRLEQVFQNLIDNALKFTPKGGHVAVALSAESSDAGRDDVVVSIRDTGCGVPQEAMERLFEPFFQVPMQEHVGRGSGLGLAIVRAVVDRHNATCDVDSVLGEGTTFTLRFPGATKSETESTTSEPGRSDFETN